MKTIGRLLVNEKKICEDAVNIEFRSAAKTTLALKDYDGKTPL